MKRLSGEPLALNHALVSAALPDMPADFQAKAERLIDSLPAERTEPMKRKVTVGLVLAIALVLLAAGALAAALLSPQEVVEQVAIPMARENDEEYRLNDDFSPEELAAFIRACEENGFTLSETGSIMNAFRQGKGYSEEETIMEVCRTAFGGNISYWTLAEQHWFWQMMTEIGWEAAPIPTPGPEDMTEEEALAKAVAYAEEAAGHPLPLTDREKYGIIRTYSLGEDASDPAQAGWEFLFEPQDLFGSTCLVRMDSRGALLNGGEGSEPLVEEARSWEKGTYTLTELYGAMTSVYGSWYENRYWSQETWHLFDTLRAGAREEPLDPEGFDTPMLEAYALCRYPLPGEGDIPQAQAEAAAALATGREPVEVLSSVLTEDGESRVWMVLCKYFLRPGPYLDVYEQQIVQVDAASGQVTGLRTMDRSVDRWAANVTSAVCDRLRGDTVTEAEAVEIAIAAIREKAGADLPLEDGEKFQQVHNRYLRTGKWELQFRALDLSLGSCAAEVSRDGRTVTVTQWEQTPATGDTLMGRYRNAYGYFGEWDQATWARLSRDAEGLTAETLQGKILLATRYPEESEAVITRAEAERIVFEAADCHHGEINVCVLIASDPHPVWKLRLLPWDSETGGTPLYEIDAVTGEVLDWDNFTPDNTDVDPTYRMYSLHRTWARLELAEAPDREQALIALAARAVFHRYGDMTLDDPTWSLPILEPDWYAAALDGLTVTFSPLRTGWPAYTVALDGDGICTRLEEIPSPEAEEREPWEGDGNG